MDISVVIPTYNSARTISQCLHSAKRQSVTCHEILVVDRYSRDGTPEIGKAAGAKVIQADVNRSSARNIGAMNCSSGAIIFVDSDMIMSDKVLEECVAGLAVHDALIIPEVSIGSGFWARCKSLERETHIGNQMLEAARCFRRNVLVSQVGGYNTDLEAGEDWDLNSRVRASGLSIGRTTARIFHDEGELSLIGALKKKYAYGRKIRPYFSTDKEASARLNPITRILTPSLRVFPSDPIHGIGLLLLKGLEFAAGGTGYLSMIWAQQQRKETQASNEQLR